MSKKTAATSRSWLLGFSAGFGEAVLRRKIASRDTEAVLREIVRAKEKLGLPAEASVKSCYEAGRDGFWLHRFLESRGIENFVIDSASIEVNDRLDVNGLVDLLARHLAGSRKPVFSVLTVPSEQAEDQRQLGRELKLVKRDRTRVSNRIKGLLANQGLVIDRGKDLARQLASLRLWNGSKLPHHLRARLERYASDYGYYTARIKELERERKAVLRANEGEARDGLVLRNGVLRLA
jgi:transposase